MNAPIDSGTTRRNVLKTAGAVGLFSLVGASGTAAAKNGDAKNNRDIGAFLNKPAAYKEDPWDGDVLDVTGMPEVTVLSGAMTSVQIPGEDTPMAPVAFAPQAIVVSTGTTVTWTWAVYPDPVPEIPHDVVSVRKKSGREKNGGPEPLFDSGLRFPGDDDFDYTFDEVGEYLYYCTPHGAPFAVESFLGGKVNNEFGMRGAIIVTE